MPARKVTDDDLGIKVLWDGAEGPDAVDVLAVHGTGAHPDDTWCCLKAPGLDPKVGTNYINWLSHDSMLPAILPNSRIMRYGYRADWYGEDSIKTSPRVISKDLLQHLKRRRKAVLDRPLLIVAHSFGGLVVLHMLLDARADPAKWPKIYQCAVGLIFLATPFRGTEAQTHHQLIELAKAALNNDDLVDEDQLRTAQAGDESLVGLVERYQLALRQDVKPKIVCFWEQKRTNIMPLAPKKVQTTDAISATASGESSTPRLVMWVDELRGTLDTSDESIEKQSFARDHLRMNKFRHAEEADFLKLTDVVEEMVIEAPVILQRRREASGRHVYTLIPFAKDADFIGREDVLAQLDMALSKEGFHNRFALTGLGGIGKSQIALEYCWRYRQLHPEASIFWVHAGSIARFTQGYQGIARVADLQGREDPKTDILRLVSDWLSNPRNGSWLLALDNVDDRDLFFKSAEPNLYASDTTNLRSHLPDCAHGRILITSRNNAGVELAGGRKHSLQVTLMTTEDSAELLNKKLHSPAEHSHALELVAALDYIPLAIGQAAAYIAESDWTVKRYLEVFQQSEDRQAALLQEIEPALRRNDDMPHAVMATWHISLKQIQERSLLASEMLSMMSMFDRQNIPRLLLDSDSTDDMKLQKAVNMLVAYALIYRESSGDSRSGEAYSMHRLVQVALRAWLRFEDTMESAMDAAVARINQHFPKPEYEKWRRCEILMPHAQVIADHGYRTRRLAERSKLLYHMGMYHKARGRYKIALQLCGMSAEIDAEIFGPEAHQTLIALAGQAGVYLNMSEHNRAEEIYSHVLRVREARWGKSDEDTLIVANDLAVVYEEQGHWDKADALYMRVLTEEEAKYGPDDARVLITVHNLGVLCRAQGRYAEAEVFLERARRGTSSQLGEDHPSTMITLAVLGGLYERQGRFVEAEPLRRRVLAWQEGQLGPDHPDTLVSMNDLCLLCLDLEKYEEAYCLSERVLGARRRLNGPEDAVTLDALRVSFIVALKRERLDEAERLCLDVFAQQEKRFGLAHAHTLNSCQGLAVIYRAQGRLEEAASMHKREVAASVQFKGPDHPHTRRALADLLRLYGLLGWPAEEAQAIYDKAVAERPPNPVVTDDETNESPQVPGHSSPDTVPAEEVREDTTRGTTTPTSPRSAGESSRECLSIRVKTAW